MQRKKSGKKPTKDCPLCCEQIHVKAIKCKHCKSMLESLPNDENTRDNKPFQENYSKINERWREEASSTAEVIEDDFQPFQERRQDELLGKSNESCFQETFDEYPYKEMSNKQQQKQEKALYLQPTENESDSDITKLYPKAHTRKRLLAFLIDGFVQAAALIPGLMIIYFSGQGLQPLADGIIPSGINYLAGGGLLIIGFLWSLFYGLTKDGWKEGQSIGKRITGLMVVNTKNNIPCSKGKSFLRQIFMLPVFYVEPIIILFQGKGKRIGDLAAKTQVIEKSLYRKYSASQNIFYSKKHAYMS